MNAPRLHDASAERSSAAWRRRTLGLGLERVPDLVESGHGSFQILRMRPVDEDLIKGFRFEARSGLRFSLFC
ncbi:hypothetical protein MPTK1_1g07950 [Marchantia polymorpha subsp. ruderalis]|uniref:Uncharacterized protein n=2 Tax=Marchantia polymorpha TaxID=3197 RepID=A0AAF6AMS2_MARPO|nr:hypothetical protein MARPO_0036s0039 [Marchantia polymorpha]BBM97742.1 hypothetical protein Mp_1g07950 [Marchantia polymorpha subsp. ruderalis]|eukprot:PTQ41045.1 hypothetical protein MARPO_0036s0039 [Marchantia polymorpha]